MSARKREVVRDTRAPSAVHCERMASPVNIDVTALCIWREARGEGYDGMHAVANVIVNRANRDKTSCDEQVMKPLQFSSMTAHGDPQLGTYPKPGDTVWPLAQQLARAAKASSLADITKGSTLYYAPKALTGANVAAKTVLINGEQRVFPKGWNPDKVRFQVAIANQLFFTEIA